MEKSIEIIERLIKKNPNAKSELNWKTPLDFMVAVILSAQATDKGVNKTTPKLFEKYKKLNDYANVRLEDLAKDVSSINFYKTKAKRIKDACDFIIKNYDGEIPNSMERLIKIPGLGRKSANVILINIFNKVEGVVVDTHITRVSQRLGFTKNKDAVKIEQDLMKLYPKRYWADVSHLFVLHGRYVCKSRNPDCENCVINELCPSKGNF